MPCGLVDATDPDQIDACADQAVAALGGLTGITNCAGSLLLKPAHLTTSAEWHATLAANLTSGFGCVRAAGRLLRVDGGSGVLVSSAAARVGPNTSRCGGFDPGLVRTPLTKGLVSSELAEKASLAMHPLGRLGEPEDVARAIAWLLDPAQGWITAQVLGVDGGLADLKR